MYLAIIGRTRLLILVGVGLLGLSAGVWGLVSWTQRDTVRLPKELSAGALEAASANPGEMMQRVREAMQRDDLTDEQRRQLRANMREVWQERRRAQLDVYFAASSEAERQRILDEQIDQMQARMREWQQRRAQWERERGARRDQAGRPDRPDRGNWTPPTRAERRERSESRDADEMGRRMAYFSALRKRMEERGIEAPFGPGRGPGARAGRSRGPGGFGGRGGS